MEAITHDFHGVEVAVIPDDVHEYLMPTQDVAAGFGVSVDAVQAIKMRHSNMLKCGVHYIEHRLVRGNGLITNKTFWTKIGTEYLQNAISHKRRGIIRINAKCIYILTSHDKFKLGITTNLKSRLNCIRGSSPLSVDVFKTWDGIIGAENIERSAHQKLSRWHSHGEWFFANSRSLSVAVRAVTTGLKRSRPDRGGTHSE